MPLPSHKWIIDRRTFEELIDFRSWKVADAREAAANYAAAAAGRVAWIRGEYDATGGSPELTGGPEDLRHLWRWLRGRVDKFGAAEVPLETSLPSEDPQLAAAPPWHDPAQPNPYFSDGMLWLMDGLGCYLAQLAAAVRPGVEWNVYRSSNRVDFNQNRTHLFGVEGGGSVDPAGMVYTALVGPLVNNSRPWDDDALLDLYRYMVDPDWVPK